MHHRGCSGGTTAVPSATATPQHHTTIVAAVAPQPHQHHTITRPATPGLHPSESHPAGVGVEVGDTEARSSRRSSRAHEGEGAGAHGCRGRWPGARGKVQKTWPEWRQQATASEKAGDGQGRGSAVVKLGLGFP